MIDFGLATILGLKEKALDWCGTLTYSSPEIINCRPYNQKTDVWSLGIVLCLLCMHRNPFYDSDKNSMKKKILEYPILFGNPEASSVHPKHAPLSEDLKNLIKGMLHKDQKKRLSIVEVLAHPWLL